MNIKIHRYKGDLLGAGPVWIPVEVFKDHIKPGQKTIEVSFENGRINIGKEETAEAPTAPADTNNKHLKAGSGYSGVL